MSLITPPGAGGPPGSGTSPGGLSGGSDTLCSFLEVPSVWPEDLLDTVPPLLHADQAEPQPGRLVADDVVGIRVTYADHEEPAVRLDVQAARRERVAES